MFQSEIDGAYGFGPPQAAQGESDATCAGRNAQPPFGGGSRAY